MVERPRKCGWRYLFLDKFPQIGFWFSPSTRDRYRDHGTGQARVLEIAIAGCARLGLGQARKRFGVARGTEQRFGLFDT